MPLNPQELLNAIYSGPFVTLAKAEFSNSKNANIQKWSAYVKGSPNRQDFLERALQWVSKGKIGDYMSLQRNRTDINELKAYFNAVIDWVSTVFLESTPAYVDCLVENLLVDVNPSATISTLGIRWPRLELFCERCDGMRGFNSPTNHTFLEQTRHEFVAYRCRDCGISVKTFALTMIPLSTPERCLRAMKFGEFPPFGSHLAKRLQALLSEGDLVVSVKWWKSSLASPSGS